MKNKNKLQIKRMLKTNKPIGDQMLNDTIIYKWLLLPYRLIKSLLLFLINPIERINLLYQESVIKRSRIFDEKYYSSKNDDVIIFRDSLLRHFMLHGWREHRNPNPFFDIEYYLNENQDVEESGINPLYHFVKYGLIEGRRPALDPDYYQMLKKCYRRESKLNIYFLALKMREIKGIMKHGYFNKAWYWNTYPDVLVIASKSIWWGYIDSDNKALRKLSRIITHPVWHYVIHGVYEGRHPSPTFNTVFYLNEHPDVLKEGMNPLFHYSKFGQLEGRKVKCDITNGHNVVDNLINFSKFKYQLTDESLALDKPLVSVIVPNYNHAKFLRKRLDTVYNQTYQNFEVILLDDCSSDESLVILKEYKERYPKKTKLFINEHNSGGVFNQWEKGLSLAEGELIWIAESDDWCTNNFLENLITSFDNEAVMLSYCQTKFMNEKEEQVWSIQDYLSEIDPDLWNHSFLATAHQIVKDAWSIKNIIPNVSSVVFRNPGLMNIFNDPEWKKMKICGDWIFYLNIIKGGLVAYTTEAINYYRIHSSNTSVSTYARDIYYQEHEMVAKEIKKLYRVSDESIEKLAMNLKRHWIQTRGEYKEEEFNACFNINKIIKVPMDRPNILMVGYGFSIGGGETFPINLANLLKEFEFGVTYLSCEQEYRESGIRDLLKPSIPVITNFYELNDIIEDFGITIIHSHHAWVDSTIIESLNINLECKHVVTLHGMYETIPKQRLKHILPRLISKAEKLVYIADKNLEPFKELDIYTPQKFHKIGNALMERDINLVNLEEYGISNDSFVLCLASRAIPEKGWEEAITIVVEARRLSGEDIHLILVGDGPEYDRLSKGAPPFIHFMGFRSNVRDYFASVDLGFLPSRFKGESYPLVIIEALQSGRPVISSDLGECYNMLMGDNALAGSVIPLENGTIPIRLFAEEIARFATDKNYYNKKCDQVKYAMDKFSTSKLVNRYSEVYSQL